MPVKRKVRAKSSTPSPDDKKSRKETGSVSFQTDKIFEALNMAEDLGKKIEHMLFKLLVSWTLLKAVYKKLIRPWLKY